MTTLVASSPPPPPLFSKDAQPPSPKYSTSRFVAQDQRPPLFSTSNSNDHSSLRPAKTIEAFKSLLPPEVEFVEGSSTGTLALSGVEGKYEPINASPKANGIVPSAPKPVPQTPAPSLKKSRHADSPERRSSLYAFSIPLTWPVNLSVGAGLNNTGNTCFLNSALQCLLHTPPLLRVLHAHSKNDPCRVKNGFCMSCAMRDVMCELYRSGRAFAPAKITRNLPHFAKHFRRGRQEDSHEFLRYAVDAFQKSCLTGYPPKMDHKVAETTWVHKIFGGRLRSRVSCTQCNYNSDTFDSILDLSIDVHNQNSLKGALKKFTAIDHLKGADKYKCEKCNRPVNAEKRFTLHDAPMVLTVHLKRFTPMGRKLVHAVSYDEHLSLQPVMSEGQFGPTYSLYGVISHAGSGPNSGHYYAHIKAANGSWYEMNDEAVDRHRAPPVGMKNAYILFYIRDEGQSLEAALNPNSRSFQHTNGSVINGMSKKRKVALSDDDGEDTGERAVKPFIGPLLPSSAQTPESKRKLEDHGRPPSTLNVINIQPSILKRKIEELTERTKSLQSSEVSKALVDYDDDEDDDMGEAVERLRPRAVQSPPEAVNGNVTHTEQGSSPERPPLTSPLTSATPSSPIAPSDFYGKRKPIVSCDSLNGRNVSNTSEGNRGDLRFGSGPRSSTPVSRPSLNGGNPYSRSRVGNEIVRPKKLSKRLYRAKRRSLM